MLPQFELSEPPTLAAALAALAVEGEPAAPLAGGTNLLPDLRARRCASRRFVSLGKLGELRRIEHGPERVTLGGRTTLTDVLRDAALRRAAPSLVQSAELFAGHMVRNAATVGGNIVYGSPSADVVPPLLSLDAEVTLASRSGSRVLPLDGFYLGYKKTAMRPDELLTAVSWRPLGPHAANRFYKLGLRKGDAITVAGVAVSLARENGRCSWARIALGSVGPTVFRAKTAEAALTGEALTPGLIERAGELAAAECQPIDDLRASAGYRRHVVGALVRRLVGQSWEELA